MKSCVMLSEQACRQEIFEKYSHRGNFPDLADLNIRLDQDASPLYLTECLLERRLRDLGTLRFDPSPAYWLTWARLTELALYCGGNYADAGEFSAAGDLLINPRLVRVYLRGREKAVTKARHLALTEQFREVADTSQGVIQWLKHNTVVKVAKEPLLCFLYESLQKSGQYRQTYLDSVDSRMKQIADTIAFLAGGKDHPGRGPCLKGGPASLSEKVFFKSKLCCFGLDHFLQLGHECRRTLKGETLVSQYLSHADEEWNLSSCGVEHEERNDLER